jgi:SAM-dependent methyltransferase
MDAECRKLVGALDYRNLDALEISGTRWQEFGFRSYRTVDYPEYDVCERPYAAEGYDLVIAEQVLEHVLWPYRAVRHVYQTLRPGGCFLVSTPFLIRVHGYPIDCSRWTELGMRHLLAEGGFDLEAITTGSWGNRSCVKANFNRWASYVTWLHSLRNEPDFPVVVWALARKTR